MSSRGCKLGAGSIIQAGGAGSGWQLWTTGFDEQPLTASSNSIPQAGIFIFCICDFLYILTIKVISCGQRLTSKLGIRLQLNHFLARGIQLDLQSITVMYQPTAENHSRQGG
ncbi:hypothetical protein D3C84_964750 [compost metagenome]